LFALEVSTCSHLKKWKILGKNSGVGCQDNRGITNMQFFFPLALNSLLNKNKSGAKLYHVGGTKIVYVACLCCDLLLLFKI
jgi:hypothetical protein